MLPLKDNRWLLFNPTCQICDLHKANDLGICDACHADLSITIHPCPHCAMPRAGQSAECTHCTGLYQAFDSAWSALIYTFPINAIFSQIKQGQNPTALQWMGRFMADCYPYCSEEDWVLVPVPMHPADQLRRGFNQTEILAAHLSKKSRFRVNSQLIRKSKRTAHQAELNRADRLSNLHGSFSIQGKTPPKRIILVDDVMTTGATAHSIATLLKSNGALEVQLWTFCRAI